MSAVLTTQRISSSTHPTDAAVPLGIVEKLLLAAGIFEVPLQFDKYFGFQETHANLGAVAGINVSVTTLSLIGLYAIWMLSSAIRKGVARQPLILGIPMLVYIILMAISGFRATNSFLTLCDLAVVAQAYLLFFYLANRIKTHEDVYFCVCVLGVTVAFQAFLIFGLAALGPSAHGKRFNIGPLLLSVWSDGRPAGSMHSAVLAGSTIGLMWLPLVGLAFSKVRKHLVWFALATMLAGLLGILLTQTRGAIISSVLGCGAIAFCLKRRNWLPSIAIKIGLIGCLIGLVPLVHVIQKRVLQDDGGSAVARKHLSLIALDAISDHPIIGYGSGNCHLACLPYAKTAQYRNEWYYTIHSKYLLTWVEMGIFGLIAFLMILANGIRHSMKAWFARDKRVSVIGLAITAGLLGHMLHMVVDIFNSRTQVQMLWIVLGLAAAVYQRTRQSSDIDHETHVGELVYV